MQSGAGRRAKPIDSLRRGHGIDVGIEIVDAADTLVDDILHTGILEDGLAVPVEGEGLGAEAHGDGVCAGAGGGVEAVRLAVIAGGDGDGARGLQQRDDEDGIGHVLPAVGPAVRDVGAAVHGRVGGVAVDVLGRRPVPVD